MADGSATATSAEGWKAKWPWSAHRLKTCRCRPPVPPSLIGATELRCAGYLVHLFRTRYFEKRETREKRGVNVKRERAWFLGGRMPYCSAHVLPVVSARCSTRKERGEQVTLHVSDKHSRETSV